MVLTRKQSDMNDVLKSFPQQAKKNIENEKNLTDKFKAGLESEIKKTLVDLESNRSDFESVLDWFAENNYFGFCREDERDPKKNGWTADKTVNELFMSVFGGIGAVGFGALLMPLCPFLGIAIIATGVIPTPIKDALKKELQEDTLNIIPFEKIPSIKDEISKAAEKVGGNVDNRIETFAKIMGDSIKKQNTIKMEEKNEKPDKQKKNSEWSSNIESDDSKPKNKNEGKEDIKKSLEEKETERKEEGEGGKNIKIKLPEQDNNVKSNSISRF